MSARENRAIVQRVEELWNTGNLAIADEIRSISPAADMQFLMRAEYIEGVQRISGAGYPVRVLSDDAPRSVMKEIQEYSPNVIVNDFPAPMKKEYLEALAKLGASTINLVDTLDDIEIPDAEYDRLLRELEVGDLEHRHVGRRIAGLVEYGAPRHHPQPVAAREDPGRVVGRVGSGGRRRNRPDRDRRRRGRVDPHPGRALRSGRAQTHLRACQPLRHHRLRLLARPGRPVRAGRA